MIGVVTLQRKSVMCLLLLVIAVLMLSGCHQQSRSAQLDIAVQQPPGVEQPTEAQPTPQARPAKPEQAEDPSFLSPESDGDYDLVFFFATADIGDYEFSIAPEGSDDWQKLDEAHWLGTCGQSEEHSRVHQQPSHISKFGFRFADEADGRYQLRTTTVGVTPAEVQELWSLEIKDQTTLLVVGSDPKTGKQLPELLPMRRCADCPQSWFFQEGDPAEAGPEVIDCCYVALPNEEAASYFLAPEGCEDWIAVSAEASDGLCENEKIHGEGYRLLRVPLDADAEGTRYQLHREETNKVTATWHDICITDDHTLLRVYRQPGSAAWQSAWCAGEELLLVESFARCGECPKNWPEGRRQKCGTTALSANADAPVGESVCGDLEFYFGADNVGWYEFSIAPEGSDAWVKLDGVCIDRGWSADGYVCPSKYGVRFEEGSGLYQLRATVKAPLPFAISNIWHNLPLQPEGALLYVACPPGTEQWQEAIAATQAVIVTQMEPEGLRE